MESRVQPQRRLVQFRFFFPNTISTNVFVKKIEIQPQYLSRKSARQLHGGLREFEDFLILVVPTVSRHQNLQAILTDPARSFNCDETFMLISPGNEKGSATTGKKGCIFFFTKARQSLVFLFQSQFLLPNGFCLHLSFTFTNGFNYAWLKTKCVLDSKLFLRKKG